MVYNFLLLCVVVLDVVVCLGVGNKVLDKLVLCVIGEGLLLVFVLM